MKKLVTLLLAVLLLFCSCAKLPQDPIESETQTTTEEASSASPDSIERFKPTGYTNGYYGFKDDSDVLNITYPKEWSFTSNNGVFDILRDGNTVGRIIGAAADDIDAWASVKAEERAEDGVGTIKILEKKTVDGNTVYRYRYVFNYESDSNSRTVTLTADCAEINEFTETKMFFNAFSAPKVTNYTLGILSDIGTPNSILILGNSFIGSTSSNIGSILNEMLSQNGKTCHATAISRGMATVQTYISDTSIMNSIRQGNYDAVFICGFYSSEEVENLGILKTACDVSNTKLVIFPAHNESRGVISSAKGRYPSLVCLDWKAELDKLITKGVDRWDLCVDDTYDHSLPPAGYVGAHMIYRAIYGELPKNKMQSAISQTQVDSILGDYAYVGDTVTIDENRIGYFN